jgi:hypothetical protein
MDKPLNAPAVFAILQRIELRRWGSQAALLCHVAEVTAAAHPEEFARGDRSSVREHTGLADITIQRHFEALVNDRVLDRRAGSGRLGHTYRVQPNVRLWRHVPWRKGTDQEALAFVIEIINGELRYDSGPRVAARTIGAQQPKFAARDVGAQQATRSCANPWRAANDPLLREPCARSNEPVAARDVGAQQNGRSGEASPYSVFDDEEEKAKQLIDAIQKVTGSPVWGGLIRRVRALARSDLALEEALAHIAAAGDRWTPPQIVGQLEARADGTPPISPPVPNPAPSPAAPTYSGWDDPSRWRIPEVDARPPSALNRLLRPVNGCQNGLTHEEALVGPLERHRDGHAPQGHG